jgi:hypothetical protein
LNPATGTLARKEKRRFFQQMQKKPPTFPPRIPRHKALVTCQVPPAIGAQDKQSMTPCHVCVESKMRFPTHNLNIKNRQKTTLTKYRLTRSKIMFVWKFTHFISAMEQVLIPPDR